MGSKGEQNNQRGRQQKLSNNPDLNEVKKDDQVIELAAKKSGEHFCPGCMVWYRKTDTSHEGH